MPVYALAELTLHQPWPEWAETLTDQLTEIPTMRQLFQVLEGLDVLVSQPAACSLSLRDAAG